MPGSGRCEVCGAWAWKAAPNLPPARASQRGQRAPSPGAVASARRALAQQLAVQTELAARRNLHRVLLVMVQVSSLSHLALLVVVWAQGNLRHASAGSLVAWPAVLFLYGLLLSSTACEAWLGRRGYEAGPRPGLMGATLLAEACSLLAYGQLYL